ncbi:MAG: asparagine synthase-related protein [Bacteroidota bacterium]
MNPSGIFIGKKYPGLPGAGIEISEINGLLIAWDTNLRPRLYLFESERFFIFAHVNAGCRKILAGLGEQAGGLYTDHSSILAHLNWGFILILNREENRFRIINDSYGIYPLFHSSVNGQVSISNDADFLLRQLPSAKFDTAGLYDFMLFNYPLKGRTLIKELSRFTGGTVAEGDPSLAELSFRQFSDIATLIHRTENKSEGLEDGAAYLANNLEQDLEPDLPVSLPLSGGFDSKMILALLLARKKPFSAYTYGSKGSVDHTSARHTAALFDLPYTLLDLSALDSASLEKQARQFIRRSPSRPLILDLMAYECVNEEIPSSNIILGSMGGELINGPVVVSEVILTRSARTLTLASERDELSSGILADLSAFPLLNREVYLESEREYIDSLSSYLDRKENDLACNLTRFMLNEVYPGFFGTVFSDLMGKFNLLNPFADLQFLRWLLNSRYRYSRHRPFSKNPVSHLFSRRLYARMIRKIHPPALYSKMDRNYLLADILYPYRWPVTILRYIENHLFRKNKTEQAKTLNYTRWMIPLLLSGLRNSPLLDNRIFNRKAILDLLRALENGQPVPDIQVRKLILILGIHYLAEEYHISPV